MKNLTAFFLCFVFLSSCSDQEVTIEPLDLHEFLQVIQEKVNLEIKNGNSEQYLLELEALQTLPESEFKTQQISRILGFSSREIFVQSINGFHEKYKHLGVERLPENQDDVVGILQQLGMRINTNPSEKAEYSSRDQYDLAGCLEAAQINYGANLIACVASAQWSPIKFVTYQLCAGTSALTYAARMTACHIAASLADEG